MFDIGFGELLLVMVLALLVLGPKRLPVAIKTIATWVRTLRYLAATIQNDLSKEFTVEEDKPEHVKKKSKTTLTDLLPEERNVKGDIKNHQRCSDTDLLAHPQKGIINDAKPMDPKNK